MKNIIFFRGGEKSARYAHLALRVVVGLIFAVHGYQKISGGIEGVGEFFNSAGIPAPFFFAYLVTYLEFFGGIALIFGFMTFWVSALLFVNMLVALFAVHLPNGFYVNKGGYEFVLLLLAALATLILAGPGMWAADRKINTQT